jgi:hypothetical protein
MNRALTGAKVAFDNASVGSEDGLLGLNTKHPSRSRTLSWCEHEVSSYLNYRMTYVHRSSEKRWDWLGSPEIVALA